MKQLDFKICTNIGGYFFLQDQGSLPIKDSTISVIALLTQMAKHEDPVLLLIVKTRSIVTSEVDNFLFAHFL